LRRSRFWRSAAWPDASQPSFLNMVAQVQTDLGPEQTLQALHRIEVRFGRRRDQPNGPRTVDLDLIAFGRRVQGAAPILPHPRAAERLFVMGPLAEIAPLWRHPISGLSAAELARAAPVGRDARPAVGDVDGTEEGE
jgi:2-amino-4-hydroxy-6-hydroxymethyldihydropteridine diphosphokinase